MPRHNTGRGGRHGQHRIVPTRFTSTAFRSCAPTKSIQLFRDIGEMEWAHRGSQMVESHTLWEEKAIVKRLHEKGQMIQRQAEIREIVEKTVPICAICMEHTMTDVVILECNHIFCRTCISTWSFKSTTTYDYPKCPSCRREFNPDYLEPYFASYAEVIKYL